MRLYFQKKALEIYESVYKSGQILEDYDKADFIELAEYLQKRGYILSPLSLKMKREFKEHLKL